MAVGCDISSTTAVIVYKIGEMRVFNPSVYLFHISAYRHSLSAIPVLHTNHIRSSGGSLLSPMVTVDIYYTILYYVSYSQLQISYPSHHQRKELFLTFPFAHFKIIFLYYPLILSLHVLIALLRPNSRSHI
jgi:hypothetical protein